MKLSKLLVATALLLIGFLVGCSKQAAADNSAPSTLTLGTLDLTSGEPSRHDAGNGESVVITASSLNANTLEIIVSLEKSGKTLSTARIMPAEQDRPQDLPIGRVHLQFTPHVK